MLRLFPPKILRGALAVLAGAVVTAVAGATLAVAASPASAASRPVPNSAWVPWLIRAGSLCPQIVPADVAAQIQVESNWQPNARSPSGAQGLAQFEPNTWPSFGRNDAEDGNVSPDNPPDAIMAAGRLDCFLASQVARFVAPTHLSVYTLVLDAYGAGLSAVIAAGGKQSAQLKAYSALVESVVPGYLWLVASPHVGIAAVDVAGQRGYYVVDSVGQVATSGAAAFDGDMAAHHLNAKIISIAATPDGRGYWLLAADGGIFSFGDARFYGSTGSMRLNAPVVGMTATLSGHGYWLVARDGGIFSFGDARFYGSTGSLHLNKPVDGMAVAPGSRGYWLVASDGGIFSFGAAPFFGSHGGTPVVGSIPDIAPTVTGGGYYLAGSDGSVYHYGNAPFAGSLGSSPAAVAAAGGVTAMAPVSSGSGYYLLERDGVAVGYGAGAPNFG